MLVSPIEIIKLLKSERFSVDNEKKLQSQIEDCFKRNHLSFEREYHLNKLDIPDFFIEGICLEIKISGNARAIYKQMERYAGHDDVKVLILATNRSMGFPQQINNKDCFLVKLGENWL